MGFCDTGGLQAIIKVYIVLHRKRYTELKRLTANITGVDTRYWQ